MSYNSEHYRMNANGFESQEELERALDNGDLEEIDNGYWDRQTGEEYWPDGEKK